MGRGRDPLAPPSRLAASRQPACFSSWRARQAWAEFKGRLRPGARPDPAGWKTRLRCALNKSPEFQEVPARSRLEGPRPYKVYRLLPPPQQRGGAGRDTPRGGAGHSRGGSWGVAGSECQRQGGGGGCGAAYGGTGRGMRGGATEQGWGVAHGRGRGPEHPRPAGGHTPKRGGSRPRKEAGPDPTAGGDGDAPPPGAPVSDGGCGWGGGCGSGGGGGAAPPTAAPAPRSRPPAPMRCRPRSPALTPGIPVRAGDDGGAGLEAGLEAGQRRVTTPLPLPQLQPRPRPR